MRWFVCLLLAGCSAAPRPVTTPPPPSVEAPAAEAEPDDWALTTPALLPSCHRLQALMRRYVACEAIPSDTCQSTYDGFLQLAEAWRSGQLASLAERRDLEEGCWNAAELVQEVLDDVHC